jgi:hypothetical protein
MAIGVTAAGRVVADGVAGTATPPLASPVMDERVSEGSASSAQRAAAPQATAPRAAPLALSVVIDGRLDESRARQVAVLAGRLGLAGVWVRSPWWPQLAAPDAADPAALLGWLSADAPTPAGLLVSADAGGANAGGANAGGANASGANASGAAEFGAGAVRAKRLDGTGAFAVPAAADGVGVTAILVPFGPDRDLLATVAAAARASRGRPVLAEVSVSVGRTSAEAQARTVAEELFQLVGHPGQQGLFGTLEECQAAAAALRHAGATELVCTLPLASDLPDVLAQLTAIAIGAGVLVPGDPPSQPPPPPAGWGGRHADR